MSLHRYIVPPPLALAVHPAPPSKPKVSDKEADKNKDKDKDKEKDKPEDKVENKDGAEEDDLKKDAKDNDNDNVNDGKAQAEARAERPPSPATPGSMLNEPPTPAPAAAAAAAADVDPDPKKANEAKVPAPNQAKPDQEAEAIDKSKDKGQPVKDSDAKAKPKAKDNHDEKEEEEEEEVAEEDAKIQPLRLLPPAPARPPRTKLDLNPSIPYPPINSDPRGAYNKYAKAFNAISDYHHIDLTKDGWLFPVWKDRAEREALARLSGEAEKTVQKEAEKAWGRRSGARKVPETSEGVLLDLWNDLVDSDHHELQVDAFWARYDWSTPEARIHLLDAKRAEDKPGENQDDKTQARAVQPSTATVDGGAGELGADQVQWTKEGVEEILGVVGVRCDYNLQKPIKHPHWSEPTSALLLLAHDHFLLRLDLAVKWQKEKPSTDFQILVVDHHDRVFGEMVRAQSAEERKKRKEKEKEAAEKAKVKEKGKDGKSDDENDDNDDDEKKDGKSIKSKAVADKVKLQDKDEDIKEEPSIRTSNAKVQNGEEVNAANEHLKGDNDEEKKDVFVLAVDVDAKDKDKVTDEQGAETKAKERDAKHDGADVAEKGKMVVVNGNGDEEGNKGQANLKDITKAVKALQVAEDVAKDPTVAVPVEQDKSGEPDKNKEQQKDIKDKDKDEKAKKEGKDEKKEPLIWTWSEKCEKWRWRNWEQGVHLIAPGGWEERDWKVFADDREVWDWEKDEAEIEVEEQDVHDWSC